MEVQTIEPAITACLVEIHGKLKEAARTAKAAKACAETGSINEAVQVSMGIEQLIFDAGRLHDAVSLLGRLIETRSSD